MRIFDVVLALLVLAALFLIARNEFPAYASRVVTHPSAAATPAAQPTAVPAPSASAP